MQTKANLPGEPIGDRGAALLCTGLGALFGLVSVATLVLAGIVGSPILLAVGVMFVSAGVVGGFFGTLCGLWIAPLLERKPARGLAGRLIRAVTPVVILAALSSPRRSPPAVLAWILIDVGIPVLWFVAYSLWLAHSLDDAYGPGQCRRCGYDLTGNISGVCPECGQETERS